jgi:hypothetical protein
LASRAIARWAVDGPNGGVRDSTVVSRARLSDAEDPQVLRVSLIEQPHEGDLEGCAELDQLVSADPALAGLDVTDFGHGPTEVLGKIGLPPSAAHALDPDVPGNHVTNTRHAVMVGRFWV